MISLLLCVKTIDEFAKLVAGGVDKIDDIEITGTLLAFKA